MTNEQMYIHILNNISDGVYFVDKDRRILFWNKAAEELTGFSRHEVIGRCCDTSVVGHLGKNGRPLCAFKRCPMHSALIDGEPIMESVYIKQKVGCLPVSISVYPVKENDQIIGAFEVFSTGRQTDTVSDGNNSLLKSLSKMAMCDQLTELPNRRKLEGYLNLRLSKFMRDQSNFCVIFMDIDNFAGFNDTYGHDVGDAVLVSISAAINGAIRQGDLFGRWGGEEFVGIFEIKELRDTEVIAEKLRRVVEACKVPHGSNHLAVTSSFGATAARLGDTVDSLIKRADEHMYHSKKHGKNRSTVDAPPSTIDYVVD